MKRKPFTDAVELTTEFRARYYEGLEPTDRYIFRLPFIVHGHLVTNGTTVVWDGQQSVIAASAETFELPRP